MFGDRHRLEDQNLRNISLQNLQGGGEEEQPPFRLFCYSFEDDASFYVEVGSTKFAGLFVPRFAAAAGQLLGRCGFTWR